MKYQVLIEFESNETLMAGEISEVVEAGYKLAEIYGIKNKYQVVKIRERGKPMDRYTFRGKRLDNGEWIYGYYVGKTDYISAIQICGIITGKCENVDPQTIGQCTGIKDKKGNLIYEGDIVRFKWVSNVIAIDEADIDIEAVRWSDDKCGFFPMIADDMCESCDCGSYPVDLEIIGNIHDNTD